MESPSISTKLAINLREGIVEAEGSEEFVRFVYQDFKERVKTPVTLLADAQKSIASDSLSDGAPRLAPKAKARRTSSATDGKTKAANYKPKVDPTLDLADLEAFYNQYDPSGHAEKILIFATFLRDSLKMPTCTADHIYSCYFILKHVVDAPKAFVQAFVDAKSRTHYIEYKSLDAIEVTIAGNNFFNRQMKRKGSN